MRLRTRAKAVVRLVLHRFGFDLVRALDDSSAIRRRVRLLDDHGVNVIFDVGANAGQYALTMRALGYSGRIVSYEPASDAFRLLEAAAGRDPHWTAVHSALGDHDEEVVLHLAANSLSSSLLAMDAAHLDAAPESAYIGEEVVPMTTLRSEMADRLQPGDRLFVKIDAQGYEREVLSGLGSVTAVGGVVGFQIELSTVQLYEGQPLIEDLVAQLRRMGYVLVSTEPGFSDPRTGRMLQVDGIFLPS